LLIHANRRHNIEEQLWKNPQRDDTPNYIEDQSEVRVKEVGIFTKAQSNLSKSSQQKGSALAVF